MNTSGFYKIAQGDPTYVVMGPNYVIGPYESYELRRELKDTYSYPVEGWYWFDSEEEAYIFFDLPYPPENPTLGLPISAGTIDPTTEEIT